MEDIKMPEIKNIKNETHLSGDILNKTDGQSQAKIEIPESPIFIKNKINESLEDINRWNESINKDDKKFKIKEENIIKNLDGFYIESLENIKKTKEIFDNLDNLKNFDEERGEKFLKEIHNLCVIIGGLIEDADKKGIKSDFIFKSFLEKDKVNAKRKELFNIEAGIYRPYTPDIENIDFDGGDGWFLQKNDKNESGFVFDARGHGNDISYEKIFIQKIFESLQNIPEEKNQEFMEKIDEAFENITHAGGHTAIAFAKISVELENGKKKVSLEKYGDSLSIIYDPENNKILYHGGLSKEDLSSDFLEMKAKDKNEQEKELNIPQIGYGFISMTGVAPVYENIFSEKAEIIVSSDGIADQHMKFKEGKSFEQILIQFIDIKKNGEKMSLVEYLKQELKDCDPEGVVDDITLLEVGSSLK